jgi:hypothetical protein
MSKLRIRIALNKGKKGIYLDKLEKIVLETRKFLAHIGEDIDVPDPNAKWVGLDFRNGSVSFSAEYSLPVHALQQHRFSEGIISLVKSQRPPYIKKETATQFYDISNHLEPLEKMRIGVFPNGNNRPKWFDYSRDVAVVAHRSLATQIEYVGAAQGIIHALYKEAKEPFFYLRELSSFALIRCQYEPDKYEEIAAALRHKEQVVHVHGRIFANTLNRAIDHIKIDRILTPRPFSFADVEEFLRPDTSVQ